jgi:hypothetical protein
MCWTFCFFAVASRYTSHSLDFFLTVNSHKLITVKILEFYMAHFDHLVIKKIYSYKCIAWNLSWLLVVFPRPKIIVEENLVYCS